jgi:hypothetical protein
MKLTITDARKAAKFSAIFANLKAFTDNVCLFYKATGVYIQCMDDSRCCLFECVLDKSWFAQYDLQEGSVADDDAVDEDDVEGAAGKQSGVNIALFQKVLHARQEKQALTLRLTSDSVDKLCIDFHEAAATLAATATAPSAPPTTSTTFDKFFELPLYDIAADVMDVKDFDTTVDLHVDSKLFCDLIGQFTLFDDNLTFHFSESQVELVSSGTNGSMKAVINVDDVAAYALPENAPPLRQSYSLRYIQLMSQFNKLAPEVQMGFSDTMPMFMRYDLGDQSHVRIHLAPKLLD